ncbi:hypothetical protein [uncultured Roseibium sp.]|uniref:hypothetical protein n=1 Tax=uncultured Roseibium sp. TaxID=1936171 RepID=UPI002602A153|nr:hypothetical protein [uncultured Roseibium sp.]
MRQKFRKQALGANMNDIRTVCRFVDGLQDYELRQVFHDRRRLVRHLAVRVAPETV